MGGGPAWRARLAYALVLAPAIAWAAGAVAAPLLVEGGWPWAGVVYYAYGQVCHQLADRSFYAWGHPLAVCARCTGIYAGFVAGLLLCPAIRGLMRTAAPPRRWLLLACLPLAVDFAGGYLGAFDNTHLSRALTGALAGAVVAFYVLPGVAAMATRRAAANHFTGEEI